MKTKCLSSLVAVICLIFPTLGSAQTIEPLFNGKAQIQVPAGAQIEEVKSPVGKQYMIFFNEDKDAVFVAASNLPRAERGWSNATWRKDRASYYSNKKNKKKYKFKHVKINGSGNQIVIESQSTFKSLGKTVTYRGVANDIRIDNKTILSARFYTKPGSWSSNDSKRLRLAVGTFKAK